MTSNEIKKLINLSLAGLKRMQLQDKTYCYEATCDGSNINVRGRSLRYTLICLIGFAKAARYGYIIPVDTEDTWETLLANFGSPELKTGDYGLYLWVNELFNFGATEKILSILKKRLSEKKIFDNLEGMERGWVLSGLCLSAENGHKDATKELKRIMSFVMNETIAPSGLFYHTGQRNFRSSFPNFATQIYCIQALAATGKALNDTACIQFASEAANVICRCQLKDGSWPWLFNAENGTVVERYEIYSVHQDAMAPMALVALFETTGEKRFLEKALLGMEWIFGHNDLALNMIDEENKFIYRSIRRRSPFNRLALYLNTLGSKVIDLPLFKKSKFLEISRTCRPYHLGWILEAWCGREDITNELIFH